MLRFQLLHTLKQLLYYSLLYVIVIMLKLLHLAPVILQKKQEVNI